MDAPQVPEPERLLENTRFVRHVARAILGNDDRVEDVVQETWLAAMRADPPRGGALRAWLRTVTRRTAFRILRQDSARRTRERNAERATREGVAHHVAEYEDARRVLVRAVLALEEPYRSVVLLRYHHGLSPSELAAALDVPLETVRTRLRRGLHLLRARLRGDERDPRALGLLLLHPWTLGAGGMAMKKWALGAAAAALLVGGGVVWRQASLPDRDAPRARDAVPLAIAARAHESEPPVLAGSPVPAPRSDGARAAGAGSASASVETIATHEVTGRLVDEEGQPVGGARVLLVHDFARRDGEPSGFSAEDGSFRLAMRQWAEDSVRVEHEGFAPNTFRLPHEAQEAEPGQAVDVGTLAVRRGATVAGRVLDVDGRPVVGASVMVAAPIGVGSFVPAHPFATSRTDEAGAFLTPAFVPHWREASLFAFAPEGAAWTALSRRAGWEDLAGVEVVLRPGASVDVEVRDPDGAPLSRALVRLLPLLPELVFMPTAEGAEDAYLGKDDAVAALFTRRTGEEGLATFGGLPTTDEGSATYVLHVHGGAAGEPLDPARQRVDVRRGETTSVTVVLAGAVLRAVRGRVLSEDGWPLAGAAVDVNGQAAATDDEGRYEVSGLRAFSRLRVLARKDGYVPAWRNLEWPIGEGNPVADFVLRRAAPIDGFVVDDAGAPLAKVTVQLMPVAARRPAKGDQIEHPSAQRTKEDGSFRFDDASAGPWRLTINPPEPYDAWEPPSQLPVEGGTRAMRIVLRRAELGHATVIGKVIDASTGRSLEAREAMLLWNGDGARPSTSTPQLLGDHVKVERAKPGRWTLWVRTTEHGPAQADVLVPDDNQHVDVEVRAGSGVLEGRVVDAGGVPHVNAFVQIRFADNDSTPNWANDFAPGFVGGAGTSPQGDLLIQRMPIGTHDLEAWAKDHVARARVTVEPGRRTVVSLVMRPTATITFESGAPLEAGTRVEVFVHDGEDASARHRFFGDNASASSRSTTVRAGSIHWRARYVGDRGSVTEWQEGTLVVSAGEKRTIVLPPPP